MLHPQVGRDAFHCVPLFPSRWAKGWRRSGRAVGWGWVHALGDSGCRVTQGVRWTEWNPSLPGSWFVTRVKRNRWHSMNLKSWWHRSSCDRWRFAARTALPNPSSRSQCAAILWDWRLPVNRATSEDCLKIGFVDVRAGPELAAKPWRSLRFTHRGMMMYGVASFRDESLCACLIGVPTRGGPIFEVLGRGLGLVLP